MAESRNNNQINYATGNQAQANALQLINHPPVGVHEGIKYGKCTHNHAALLGRHATDGCNQFVCGKYDPLYCTVCGCHRNYHEQDPISHRRHRATVPQQPPQSEPVPIAVAPINALAGGAGPSVVTPVQNGVRSEVKRGSEAEVEAAITPRPRRTKFTEEQKRKMTGFAVEMGWRSRRADKEEIEEFCEEVGISSHSFKVWLSNNRHRRDVL